MFLDHILHGGKNIEKIVPNFWFMKVIFNAKLTLLLKIVTRPDWRPNRFQEARLEARGPDRFVGGQEVFQEARFLESGLQEAKLATLPSLGQKSGNLCVHVRNK